MVSGQKVDDLLSYFHTWNFVSFTFFEQPFLAVEQITVAVVDGNWGSCLLPNTFEVWYVL
jgi:hypothetical protein